MLVRAWSSEVGLSLSASQSLEVSASCCRCVMREPYFVDVEPSRHGWTSQTYERRVGTRVSPYRARPACVRGHGLHRRAQTPPQRSRAGRRIIKVFGRGPESSTACMCTSLGAQARRWRNPCDARDRRDFQLPAVSATRETCLAAQARRRFLPTSPSPFSSKVALSDELFKSAASDPTIAIAAPAVAT